MVEERLERKPISSPPEPYGGIWIHVVRQTVSMARYTSNAKIILGAPADEGRANQMAAYADRAQTQRTTT